MSKFYLTTPIYYVNDKPHIGHTYTTVLADVLARYHRLAGDDVFFLTGTDEHGQKIAQAAQTAGVTPQQHCDKFAQRFKEMWEKIGISYDRFIRTTEVEHVKIVQDVLQKLFDKKEIYRSTYEGWYCVPDERFWTEKDLIDGKCPECGRLVTKIEEENYFFKMSVHQQWLIDYINDNPEFIQPDFRRNEVLGFLKRPLNDLCISRPKKRLSWGVELPFDNEYVCYVWVDALLNYCSAIGLYGSDGEFDKWWPADYHLIGKDILTTHAVYWPILLHALNIEMPRTIFAHGWWMIDEKKMGKSVGNAVDPYALEKVLGADRLRYYLMRDMVMGQDASYSLSGLLARLNNDLSNDLGNMVSRVTNMVAAYFDGTLPAPAKSPDENTRALLEIMSKLAAKIWDNVRAMKIHSALEEINAAIRAANKYIETTQPWQLAKEGKYELLGTVLFTATQLLAKVGILIYPVMPDKCAELLETIGYSDKPTLSTASQDIIIPVGTRIRKPKAIFPRIDAKKAEKALGVEEIPEITVEDIIDIEHFSKIRLVVGKVLSARSAPNAEKLLLLDVDIGTEKRQLVAGIAQWFTPEQLQGENIIVIANLKPAIIRGHESQGMLLAADDGKNVTLVTVDKDVPPGSKVR